GFIPLRDFGNDIPIIAPMLSETSIDTLPTPYGVGSGSIAYGPTTVDGHQAFQVDWRGVAAEGRGIGPNTCSLTLSNRSDVRNGPNLRIDSDNDGIITSGDDAIENDPNLPGKIINVNDNNDNNNLVPMEISLPSWMTSGTVTLSIDSGADKVNVYSQQNKSGG